MKNLPITLKVSIGYVAMVLMFVLIVVSSTRNITRLDNNIEWVQHSQDVLAEIQVVLGDLKDAEVGQRGYIITGDEAYLEPYNVAVKTIEASLDELMMLTSDNPTQQQLLDEVNELTALKLEKIKVTIEVRKNDGFLPAQQMIMTNDGKTIMDEARVLFDLMMVEEAEVLHARQATSVEGMMRSKLIAWALLLLAVILAVGSVFLVHSLVVGPIVRLSVKAKQIARGNLSNEFNKDGRKDEIGLLARAFKIMQENLLKKAEQAEQIADGNLTVNVRPLSEKDAFGLAFSKMVEHYHVQMMEIKEGINVLSTSSNEMMAVMSQLATGAAETATSVSETTSTVEEIKQTAEVSSQKSNEVAESSKELAIVSKNGNDSVQRSIEGMLDIKQQMESIAAIVIQLSERSHKIGEIANTVNDIAEQSNLLAVNASIEASKAGEYGKGFTVVAQEIKNLATRSKESTVEIRSILADIQREISSAVLATEQGGKVIEDGLVQSQKASDIISLLADNSENASQANLLISATSQQQLVGMDQIATAMESIKEASMQNSNSTKQAELSVSELKDLGGRLIKLVERYKLTKS